MSSSVACRFWSSSPCPRGAFGNNFGSELLVSFVHGRLMLIGIFFASIFWLSWNDILPKTARKYFSLSGVFFLRRVLFLSVVVVAAVGVFFFSCSVSLCVCLLEERKISLKGHTPTPLAHVFWSAPFAGFFLPPVSAVRLLLLPFLGVRSSPRAFLGLPELGA